MLPFCGYHICDYLQHWLDIGEKSTEDKLPKIFFVNWFRRGPDKKFLWPGFGDNSRVLKWIIERVSGTGHAVETPIGYMPTPDDIDRAGLDATDEELHEILTIDKAEWEQELASIREYYAGFGDKLPKELMKQLEAVEERLSKF